ncbi:MAG: hypothetical protein MUO91_01155 [candidate division Zixibacteria bacterium]|nr:hypothetical protein [candidate division Zixibacteria bacterium]
MIEKTVILPVSTPVEVELSADSKGIASLGIRINGSNWCPLASGVTMPAPGNRQTWPKTIGDIWKAPPSTFP